jgi:hypothetical protein
MTLKKKSLIIIALLGVIFALVVPNYAPGGGHLDFMRYWAASHLFVTGENAYDSKALLELEKSINFQNYDDLTDPEFVSEAWNPPWLLALLAPLGWLPFNLALRIWIFLNTFIIGFSAWLTWEMLGFKDDEKGFAAVLAATFWSSNTILTIQIGQIASLLLLAVVLFIYFIQKNMDFWAGLVLFPLTFKPHIAYLVLLTIGIWVLARRRWGVIGGALFISFLMLAVVTLISPSWPAEYFGTLSTLPFNRLSTSTLGSLVEMTTGFQWLRYLFVLLLPLAFYFARNVENFGWITTINLVLLLSLPLSFYGFSFDQIICLPAVAELIAWLRADRLNQGYRKLVIGGLVIVYLAAILIRFIPGIVYGWTVLPAILLLLVYFYTWHSRKTSKINLQER